MSPAIEAWRVLSANLGSVGLYIAICLGTASLVELGETVLADGLFFSVPEGLQLSFQLILDIALAAGYAAGAALGFSRLGREIDCPLWKVAGDGEALRRFFALWFVLSLVQLTLLRLMMTASNDAVIALLRYCYFLLALLLVPLGACNMFPGSFEWGHFVPNLAPLLLKFMDTLAMLFVNLLMLIAWFVYLIFMVDHPSLAVQFWPEALFNAFCCLIDCYVFAGVWLICMEARKTMEERGGSSGYDF